MQITWHGHSCFSFKNSQTTLVTDPYDPKIVGLNLPKLTAELVTISHAHPGHNCLTQINGTSLVFDSPGEYEARGVAISGIASWHNSKDEKDRGPNNIFAFSMDNIKVCHLGDLGHVLTAKQNDELGEIDILLVPVGGVTTLNVSKTRELIEKISPRLIIPMHYKLPGLKYELGSLEDFIKEMGLPASEKLSSLKIEKKDLPKDEEDYKLQLLEPVLA